MNCSEGSENPTAKDLLMHFPNGQGQESAPTIPLTTHTPQEPSRSWSSSKTRWKINTSSEVGAQRQNVPVFMVWGRSAKALHSSSPACLVSSGPGSPIRLAPVFALVSHSPLLILHPSPPKCRPSQPHPLTRSQPASIPRDASIGKSRWKQPHLSLLYT